MVDLIYNYNDEFYSQQWGLNRIDITSAWTQSTGNNITVAVIDHGVELDHPDLAANMHPQSFDCVTARSPQQVRGNHGTAVAGIIGAVRDNGIGIVGVAPHCRIMPISHPLAGTGAEVQEQYARGFDFAWRNGADVINCSWGHPTGLSGSYITNAIVNAITNGRGGRGCVVVAAAGNEGSNSISYPALLTYAIAVGSIDQNGRRASYSNSGGTLNVMAPGEGIWSTDRQGGLGYNTAQGTAGNYVEFGGTSAAAPFVSGIAALILSIYPDLPWRSVHNAIEQGTKWLGYTVTQYRPNGPYNPEVGYGMVDARSALIAAKAEMDLVNLSSTPAIDFRITNNTSYDVNSIWITMTGKVGSTTTTLIQHDPGSVPARSVLEGFPNYPGNKLTAAPGTAITNLNLQLYANTSGNDKVRVYVSIDNYAGNIWKEVNFNGGNTVNISPPNTTVPSASRRTLNIVIERF